MQEHFQFDRERFKDVVHFAVHTACAHYGSDALGNTKLHKILYYVDILKFLDTGIPLTGEDYLRQRFGPTARHLTTALRDLEGESRVSLSTRNYYGYQKSDYCALAEPQLGRLSAEDVQLIEHIVGFVCAHTAVEISEFSHDAVWESVPMGQRIPYYAAFAMFPGELTEEDIEEAADEAVRIAPLIEAEQRGGSVF